MAWFLGSIVALRPLTVSRRRPAERSRGAGRVVAGADAMAPVLVVALTVSATVDPAVEALTQVAVRATRGTS